MKKTSKTKIFALALLCYVIMNIAYSIAYLIIGIVFHILPFSFDNSHGLALMAGIALMIFICDKIAKSDIDEHRIAFTVGVITIVFNTYSLISSIIWDEYSYHYVLFVIFGILIAITERKKYKEALTRSEQNRIDEKEQ